MTKFTIFILSAIIGLVVQFLVTPTSPIETNPIYGWTWNYHDIGPFPAGTQIIQYDQVIAEVTENNTVRHTNAPFPESITVPFQIAWETDVKLSEKLGFGRMGYEWKYVPVGNVTIKNDNTFTYVSDRRNDPTVYTGNQAADLLIEDWKSASTEADLLSARAKKRVQQLRLDGLQKRIDLLLQVK